MSTDLGDEKWARQGRRLGAEGRTPRFLSHSVAKSWHDPKQVTVLLWAPISLSVKGWGVRLGDL